MNVSEDDSDAERHWHKEERTYMEKISGSPLQTDQGHCLDDERIAGSLIKQNNRVSPKTRTLIVSRKSLC